MSDVWAVWAFWIAVAGVFYPYGGYPLVLLLVRRLSWRPRPIVAGELPTVSLIIPVHNESPRLQRKIANTLALDYPADRMGVVVVSDGSTDGSTAMLRTWSDPRLTLIELPERRGKAAALNAGLACASGEIVVFSDASINLARDALRAIVRPFADPWVGCVSGEDRIADAGAEGLYGRYELYLRRLESDVYSIVGASGCFYAQRRALCAPFPEGMAPDFISVLRTVQQGYRAVSEPAAVGHMSSVQDPKQEFNRKVRTLLRGMTALFAYKTLLNPLRYGVFALELWSHKVLRWTVPFCLIAAVIALLPLLDQPLYALAFSAQAAFYLAAIVSLSGWANLHRTAPGRITLYFSSVNAAILAAWYRYWVGVRQELWTPTRR